MVEPRIILLNDPTRGIDVGTKQEIYQLLRRLADAGAAIIFYSTDYDELIGCCDRVLVLYDGAIKRELVGDEITERALIASALNIADEPTPALRGRRAMSDWRYWLAEQPATLIAFAFFVVMFAIYVEPTIPPGSAPTWSRRRPTRACCWRWWRWRRPCVVITAGIDLSVGMVFMLTNCLASCDRRRLGLAGGARRRRACCWRALACGAVNGLIVIFGRLQPIVTTIATGAIFFGLALALRPTPGRRRQRPLADALTGRAARRPAREPRRAGGGRARRLGSVPPLADRPGGLRGRLVGTGRLHVGRAGPPREIRRLHARRACSRRWAACS